MNLKTHIQNLHTFSIPTRLVEIGCGLTLSNLLYSENNASHTVYDVHSPYNRKAQLEIDIRVANHRAVSMENTTYFLLNSLKDKEDLVHYVANFQIGGGDNPKTTHGYIMIGGNELPMICYHVTIPGENTREYLLNEISKVGFSILYNRQIDVTNSDNKKLPIDYVDQVMMPFVNSDGEVHDLGYYLTGEDDNIAVTGANDITLELFLGSKLEDGEDNLLCYHNGHFVRFEDFFRDKKKVMIYRGTFNPITNAHLTFLERAVLQENPDLHALMIARNIYGKNGLSKNEIRERMSYADSLGLPLIIGYSFRYIDTIKHLRKRLFDKTDTELQFIMGADTVQRVFQFEPDEFFFDVIYKNVTYVYVKRIGFNIDKEYQTKLDGLVTHGGWCLKFKVVGDFNEEEFIMSSTQARQLLKDGDFSKLEKLLPQPIYDIFKNMILLS